LTSSVIGGGGVADGDGAGLPSPASVDGPPEHPANARKTTVRSARGRVSFIRFDALWWMLGKIRFTETG
jgi:hypothetical protein